MKLYELRPKRVAWRRSSFCAAGECAELAQDGDVILLRSSVTPRVVIKYTRDEFRALRLAIQSGEFDDFA